MTIKVLVADDHAIVRDGLRALLATQPGISVVGDAADGREAVRLAQQKCPDIVLMDIAMPGLNGLDAAQQIAETCPETKVIVLSMHASYEHIQRAFSVGVRGYLLKEVAGVEVVDAVREVHRGHRYLCQAISDRLVDDYVSLMTHQAKSPLQRLSAREREVLQLMAEGKSTAEIAKILDISPKSLGTYRSRLMEKLGINDVAGLVRFALEHGLTI